MFLGLLRVPTHSLVRFGIVTLFFLIFGCRKTKHLFLIFAVALNDKKLYVDKYE